MKRYLSWSGGKKYLYDFLKQHGYNVPKMREMNYEFYRGSEWLKAVWDEIEVFSPARGVIYVTLNDIDDETGEKTQAEYSKYVDGVLTYQTKYGKTTIVFCKKYTRVTT